MRILVTGASGMLGGRVARALAARGEEVTVLQRRPAGLGLRERLADVADAAAVQAAVAGQDGVIHLAAKVDLTGPWTAFEAANITGTRNVVDACRRAGVPRLVQVSSPSVAHAGSSLVGAEAEPADPATAKGPYARSKAQAELVALAADGPELAVLAVRPHLVWGPGDLQIVERVVDRARRGRLPVVGSGAALVDTTYVSNAVDALLAALDRCTLAHGRAVVVSNGEPRPIAELFGAICAAAGVPVLPRRVPVRVALAAGSLVERLWALRGSSELPPMTRFLAEQMATAHWFDQRETRRLLGWRPRVGLEEGFAELRRFYASGGTGGSGSSGRRES